MKISDPVLQNIVSLLEPLESLSLKALYMSKMIICVQHKRLIIHSNAHAFVKPHLIG